MKFKILMDDLQNGYAKMDVDVPKSILIHDLNIKPVTLSLIYHENEDTLEKYFAQKAREHDMVYLEPIFNTGGDIDEQ